jgi:hypothetical protein
MNRWLADCDMFLQDLHCTISQKTAFFLVTAALKTSNRTQLIIFLKICKTILMYYLLTPICLEGLEKKIGTPEAVHLVFGLGF